MTDVKEHIKRYWWNYTFWIIIFSNIIISIPYFFNGWVRWKWGYYNIDLIPFFIIILILYEINKQIRLSRIEKKLEEQSTGDKK